MKSKRPDPYRIWLQYVGMLILCPLTLAGAWLCAGGSALDLTASHMAARACVMEEVPCVEETCVGEEEKRNVPQQRILECRTLIREPLFLLDSSDYDTLLRIVEAEAGGEDENGKLLVANVVLNRVKNDSFPDTVTEVVYQRENGICQFSPVSDGRIDTVEVSAETKAAVERAVMGEDISRGALYFVSRKAAAESRMRWFDTHLTWLFAYGGHEFFG